jgi:class 3 adenylate cyclase
MAIFLDRHDMDGITAAQAADAHQRDVGIQDRYGVRFLTYWFDEPRGMVFCLVDAPDEQTAQRVHAEAHGHVAGQVIPVDLSAVEAFLGRLSDPKHAPEAPRPQFDSAHRAVMFTDIAGSTEMTARLGDVAATELVRAHDALVRRALARNGGREVKHLGDGIMASFDATSDAVSCAKEIQHAFHAYNAERGAQPLHVRIGIASGEPIEDSSDLFGTAVQMAARLCSAANPDEVLVSSAVCEECSGSHTFSSAGYKRLKGFAEPVRAFVCA